MNERTHRVAGKLRFRLAIFLLIGLAILGFVTADVVRGDLPFLFALGAIALGIGIGYIIGRVANVKWHDTETKVVTQMDAIGFIAILAYIGVRLVGNWLFAHWLSGAALSAFTLALLGGALVGRFLGLMRAISKVLDRASAPD